MADAAAAPPGFTTLSELEAAAGAKVAPAVWDYIQGGSGVERTLAANRSAFDRRSIRPRVLRDVSVVDLSATLLGQRVSAPFFVAPTAYHGAVDPEGECATARAAARVGVLAAFSTLSSRPLEEIAAASGGGSRWFQLYLQPDPAETDRLLARAEAAGFGAVVLTADAPVLAGRDRQIRSGFAWERPPTLGNGPEVQAPGRLPTAEGHRFRFRSETAATWKVVRELAGATRLPVLVKGVLRGDDARRAVAEGARGVVVSNHGGRQLDGSPATLDALPEVVAAVGGSVEVFVDGGFRRGSDVLTALALGARGVGLGRPVLWALGAAGEAGVVRYLQLLRTELAVTLALAGCRDVAEVDGELLGGGAVAPRPRRAAPGATRSATRRSGRPSRGHR